MSNQINTQEVIKKDFLNIFEISHLFNVSAITARRHIKEILEKIGLLEDKLKLSAENDKTPIVRELNSLAGLARKRVTGQTLSGESMYVLEIANKEAFSCWELRPTIKAVIQDSENLSTQIGDQVGDQADHLSNQNEPMSNQNPDLTTQNDNLSKQKLESEDTHDAGAVTQKSRMNSGGQVAAGDFGEKYIQLLEDQLSEKDATIKDLRETNKFLSITNGKLNEQLRFLLERPKDSPPQEE